MVKLITPIPSPVPLETLATLIGTLLRRIPTKRPHSSAIVTRLANVCQRAGIEQVWMLAIHPRAQLYCLKHCSINTVDFAEVVLKPIGCHIDMFPQLREIIEAVVVQARKRPNLMWLTPFQVLMALAGIGDWAKNDHIIAALADHGLHPDMPLEELFVHDPSLAVPVEPKKLTAAEEVAAFLGAKIMDLCSGPLPAELQSIIGVETTVGECALIVALARMRSTQHVSGLDACARVLNRLAREHLSPEALVRLGITD